MPTTPETNTDTTTIHPTYKCRFITPRAMKKYIRERLALLRPAWKVTNISEGVLIDIENAIKHVVDDTVRRHPSRGKTLMSLNR